MAFVVLDGLFVIMGALMLGFCLIVQNELKQDPTEGVEAARNLFYSQFPLEAGIAASVFYFITFAVSIPAIMTQSRGTLKLTGYMVSVTAFVSLIVGLIIWIQTLKTRETFAPLYIAQSAQVQSLMQTAFNCCGYFNSSSPAFVTSPICPSPAAAALQRGCGNPIASFGNIHLDNIFTAVFGMCGIGGLLVMATACLLKDRKEQERFRHIDEKNGF